METSKMTTLERIKKSNRIIENLEKQGFYTRSSNNITYVYKFNQKLHLKKEYGYITDDFKVVMY